MKKKLLTLIAVFGLGVSSWAMAPHADAAGPVPGAEAGYAVVEYTWEYFDWQNGSFVYQLAMAFSQAAGAAVGGILGGKVAGPVGMVIGGGLGAA